MAGYSDLLPTTVDRDLSDEFTTLTVRERSNEIEFDIFAVPFDENVGDIAIELNSTGSIVENELRETKYIVDAVLSAMLEDLG